MGQEDGVPVVYFIEKGLYKARLNHLVQLAEKCSFIKLAKQFSEEVTHIIAQNCSQCQATDYLKKVKKVQQDILRSIDACIFVDVSWFVTCLKEKKVVKVSEHSLKRETEDTSQPAKKIKLEDKPKIPMYACQRSTPFNHKNKVLTDALEILEEHAIYRGDLNAEVRALAFRRGSATLKSLDFKVSHVDDLINLPYIDTGSSSKPGHCKRVLMDILSYGHSSEVEEIQRNEFFQSMKLFTGIFGVGPQTARKWYHDLKFRALDEIKDSSAVQLNRDQRFGLEYYDDLNSPLPVDDARGFEKLINDLANKIQTGIEITLVGGFRRGKPSGHDMDLLITHPEEGKEKILHLLLEKLKDRIIYSDKKAGSVDKPFSVRTNSTMDHFEKCYGIFKIDKTNIKGVNEIGQAWTARRVDLIVVPYSQFPYALLGWSGSRHFEREIRRYAKSERQMVLTSHGMYTIEGKQSVPATSEEEIFQLLGLKYQEPCNRNC